ncbi:helix-turn-helix domain-containing protein [Actinomadura syzygii]|uniref:Helix-turn-helix domain-containing protein n=2 Tax=Actinomadura syzygii TaxID=1427538 RepID=A0A5D0UCH9_9ACTN|nr:helix-turn-helix domain-containing protein [Actinomadura syzygii]
MPAPPRPEQREGPTLIRSVQRALSLLSAISDEPDGAPAKRLARVTGLPLATTYHLLRTLAYEGYATCDRQLWTLGPECKRLQP